MQCAKCFESTERGPLRKCDGKSCTKRLHLSCANKVSVEQGYVFYYCNNHFQVYNESAIKFDQKNVVNNSKVGEASNARRSSERNVNEMFAPNVNMRRRIRRNDLNTPEINNDIKDTIVDPPTPSRSSMRNLPAQDNAQDNVSKNNQNENDPLKKNEQNIFQKLASSFSSMIGMNADNKSKKEDDHINEEDVCHACEMPIINRPFNCRYCLLNVHFECIDPRVTWSISHRASNFTCLECRNRLNNFNRSRDNRANSLNSNNNNRRPRVSTGNVPDIDSFNPRLNHTERNRTRASPISQPFINAQPIEIEINGYKLPVNNEYIMSERMINQNLPVVVDTERTWRIFYQTYKSSKNLFNDASNIVRITKAIQCQAIKDIGGENLYELNHYDNAIEDINKRLHGTEQLTIDLRKRIYAIEKPENNDHEGILKAIDSVKNFYNLICKENKDEYLYDANLCVDIISKMPMRVYNRLSSERLKAKKNNRPYFIADIMHELESVLEDSKHKLDMERIVNRHKTNKKKFEKSYFTECDNEIQSSFNTSVIKKQFHCWLHDSDSHSPNKCRTLWQMSGLEARKIAIEKRRCLTCGLNRHNNEICPYAKALKCNLANCDENHHALFCAKRLKKVAKKTYSVEASAEELAYLQECNECILEETESEEVKAVSIEKKKESILNEDMFYFRISNIVEKESNIATITKADNRYDVKDAEDDTKYATNTSRLEIILFCILIFMFNFITGIKDKLINTIHHSLNKPEKALNTISDKIYNRVSAKSQLPIVVTTIMTPYGNKRGTFLLDSGSTTSLINTRFANELLAKGIKSNLTVKGINAKKIDNKSRIIQLKLCRPDNENCFTKVAFHTFDDLNIAEQKFESSEYYKKFKYLKPLNLLNFHKADGLIGIDNIKIFDWNIVKYKRMEPHYPLGIRTVIGDTLICSEEQTNDIYEEGLKLNDDKEEFVKLEQAEGSKEVHFVAKTYSINCTQAINEMERTMNNDYITDLNDYEEEYLKIEELIFLQNSHQFDCDSRDNYFEHVAKKMLDEETIKMPNSYHYKAPILWKDRDNVVMPAEKSYKNAMRRFLIIEKYGKANNEFHEYEMEVRNLLEKGYAVELSETEAHTYSRFTYYVPIFFINPPNKRRRIIFDFKAKVNGVSFNENIIGNLNLLNRIDKILFDARKEKYLIKGDIKEMFLQIALYEEDCDSMRFLFRFRNENEIKTYKMKVLPFGCASSPTISQFVKNRIAETENVSQLVKTALLDHTYMDDTIKSVPTSNDAIELVKNLKACLKSGGFSLLKINTNDSFINIKLKEALCNEHQEKLFTNERLERLLGYEFDLTEDTITTNFSIDALPQNIIIGLNHPTRRNVLQVMNALFDPLGLFGYVTAKMKIVYKRVCETTNKWDDKIDSKLIPAWETCLKYYNEANKIKVPRWNTPKDYNRLELLIFCDASKEMICTVAYIRAVHDASEEYTLSILTSKSHTVSNKREYTIPELELEAANQAVKLKRYIIKTHSYTFHDIIYFSDSKINLDIIKKTKREKFTVYTENRIKYIKENSKIEQWYWVPSELQAADVGTKIEAKVSNSLANIWFTPRILQYKVEEWTKFYPKNHNINFIHEEHEGDKKKCENERDLINADTYKNFTHLIRTSVLILKYKYRRDTKFNELKKEIVKINANRLISDRVKRYDVKEIERKIKEIECFIYDESHWFHIAETHWLRYAQSQDESLKEIVNLLKSGKNITQKNKYFDLHPYLDVDGLLRLRTRIADKIEQIYSLDYDKIRPIILPQNNGITDLIVLEIHAQQGHMLLKTTANQIRSKYYIRQLETTVRNIIKEKCHYCRRFTGRAQKPIMGDIPIETFGCFESSFIKATADVFGPIEVKPTQYSKKIVKRYGLVIMCLNTRSTHIEVLPDLTTESHIKAFEMAFAIRGTPRVIYTDLHPSFLATNKMFIQLTEEWNNKLIKEGVIRKHIKWETKAAYMSWNQGVVERQIGEIKKLLRNFTRILNMNDTLTDYELRYLFIKILNVLNNTPITCFEDNKQIPQLTPAHFLMLRENTQSHPKTNITSTDLSTTWVNIQSLINSFWQEWLKSYFPKYLNRKKWNTRAKPLEIGAIVLCAEKGIVDSWRIGRIISVDCGSNDQVRSVTIKLGKNRIIEKKRLTNKKAILEAYRKETSQIVTRPAMLVIELNIKSTKV